MPMNEGYPDPAEAMAAMQEEKKGAVGGAGDDPVILALRTVGTFASKIPEAKAAFQNLLNALAKAGQGGAGMEQAPAVKGKESEMSAEQAPEAEPVGRGVKTMPEHAGKGAVPVM